MEFIYGGSSEIGMMREKNQDSLYIRTGSYFNKKFCLAIICDGVGSLQDSELAGIIGIQALDIWFEKNLNSVTTLFKTNYQLIRSLEQKIYQINRRIVNLAIVQNLKIGSTLSVLFIINRKYYLFHAGDTRVYKINDHIEQLSKDHTLTQHYIVDGIIVKKKSNVLTKTFGYKSKLELFTKRGDVSIGDFFLLCTDGIYEKIDDEMFQHVLRKKNAQTPKVLIAMVKQLTDYALLNGCRDNLTVGIIRVIEG